jgi:S1-C subfamily serine protease
MTRWSASTLRSSPAAAAGTASCFVIPSNLVKLIVDIAATGRKLERPWLGAKLDAVSELDAALKERQRIWLVVVKRGNQTVRLQLPG